MQVQIKKVPDIKTRRRRQEWIQGQTKQITVREVHARKHKRLSR